MTTFTTVAQARAYVDRIPFLEARWYSKARIMPIQFLVVHTMENTEANNQAEQWQQMTHTQDRKSSVHCGVDADSTRMAVRHYDTAYHVGYGNRNTWGCEHTGRAAQSPGDWADPFSRTMLTEQSAPLFAAMSLIAEIPIRRATTEDYMASRPDLGGTGWHEGRRGILGHRDVARAIQQFGLPDSGHTDPGEFFPWTWYLDQVRSHLEAPDMPLSDEDVNRIAKAVAKELRNPSFMGEIDPGPQTIKAAAADAVRENIKDQYLRVKP